MKDKRHPLFELWRALYPLLFYYSLTLLFMYFCQLLLGRTTQMYMLCQIITSAVMLPLMYFGFFRGDKMLLPFRAIKGRFGAWADQKRPLHIVLIILCAACFGIALNNLILMSPLVEASSAYQEATEYFYGSGLIFQLIGSAILTPILEELVYRGILYNRLKHWLGFWPAFVIAPLVFGIMHFNLVQFVYAVLLGFLLVIFMEKSGHVYGAILGHITVNTISVLRTSFSFLDWSLKKDLYSYGFVVLLFILGGVLLFVLLCNRKTTLP